MNNCQIITQETYFPHNVSGENNRLPLFFAGFHQLNDAAGGDHIQTHSGFIKDDDVACLRVSSIAAPIASQFDGDYLGVRETMTFRAVPDALPVVAPPAKNCA